MLLARIIAGQPDFGADAIAVRAIETHLPIRIDHVACRHPGLSRAATMRNKATRSSWLECCAQARVSSDSDSFLSLESRREA